MMPQSLVVSRNVTFLRECKCHERDMSTHAPTQAKRDIVFALMAAAVGEMSARVCHVALRQNVTSLTQTPFCLSAPPPLGGHVHSRTP